MPISELPTQVDTFVSSPEAIILAVIAGLGLCALFVSGFVIDYDWAGRLAAIGVASCALGSLLAVVVVNSTNNEQRVEALNGWLGDTYGVDIEISIDKVSALVSHDEPITITDNGRVFNLAVTGDDEIVLLDSDGNEAPHVDQ